MKRLILTFAMVCCFALPASAITGLGFGIHGGLGMNYSFSDVATDEVVDSLVPVDFEDNLTVIGGHVNIGTFPVLDFTIFGDYAWKSTDISDDYSFKVHDLSFGASVKKKFDVAPIIKPYLLVGGGMHAIVYTGKNKATGAELLLHVDDESKFGFHFGAGVDASFPVFPFAPFIEGRYNIISTSGESTKYFMLLAGISINI